MNKLIKTAEDYEEALGRLHALLDKDPHPGSDVSNEVELLALLITSYERERFERLPAPTAIEAIRFRMEQSDLVQKDLAQYIGSPGRVSEVLAGKRRLTLPMIRALSEGLHIPTNVLINQEPADKGRRTGRRKRDADRKPREGVSKAPAPVRSLRRGARVPSK